MTDETQLQIAQKVKAACIEAAKDGFRDASMSGICADGAIEAAVGAIQKLDLEEILNQKNETTNYRLS